MKVEVKENTEKRQAKPFPRLMKSPVDGTIVLFIESGVGVVVEKGNSNDYVGCYHDSWWMDSFKDFDGTITLSND